jgi:hypothetical protein
MDYREPLTNQFGPVSLSAEALRIAHFDRPGPTSLDELSLALVDRHHADPTYRPKTLDGVYDKLYRLTDDERGALRARIIARDGGPTHDLKPGGRPRQAI